MNWIEKLEEAIAITPDKPPAGYESVQTWANRWGKSYVRSGQLCRVFEARGIMKRTTFKANLGRRAFAYKWIGK
jgi:hypothetical protein